MIKAIFFDFDGVLTTDATGTTSIVKYLQNTTNVNIESFEKAYRKHNDNLLYGKTTHTEVWPQLCAELQITLDIQLLQESFRATPMDKTMLNLAQKLKADGFSVGIITDNKKDRIDTICKKHELQTIFNPIIISSEIGSGKKHQNIFDAAMKECKVRSNECVFIDNTKENLAIPQSIEMETLYFDHEERNINTLTSHIQEIIQKKLHSM